jgi:transcription antitermination factor NusG
MTDSSRDDTLQWFALSVKPRFDKTVTAALKNKGFDSFLALGKKRNTYGVRCREVELPIFPGYVFCQFNVLSRLPILTTPGVLQILGVGSRPYPVPNAEIASLKTVIDANISIRPFPFPPIGHQVYIEKGALAGVHGTVVSIKHSSRIVLSITLLQRSVLLETDCDQVALRADFARETRFETTASPSR